MVWNLLRSDIFDNKQAYDVLRDMCKFIGIYLNFDLRGNEVKDEVVEYCILNFMNKSYNNINFSAIFNKYRQHFPINNINVKKAFKYNKTIGRIIYNYKNIDYSADNICLCDNFKKYIDPYHKHIITGNLDIVNDSKLRNIMKKGTNFRLQVSNQTNRIKKQIIRDLDDFFMKLAIKYNLPIESFKEFGFFVKTDIFENNLKTDYDINLKDIKDSIKDLQNSFIVTYIDKASNNFAIICKHYYIKTLKDFICNNQNYELCKFGIDEIKKKIVAVHKKLKMPINNNILFPYMFLTPKFHKNPISFRTVTSGYNTYINKTGKVLQNILQKIINNLDSTAIINNSYDLVNKLANIKIYSVYSYDFEDLFNNIDIKDLFSVMEQIYFRYADYISFNYNDFILLLNFVLRDNYIIFDGLLYHQIKGIGQGASASNGLANLYLHFFEEKYWNDLVRVCFLFRYIDDVIYFGKNYNFVPDLAIYPSYLKLKLINNINIKTNFLDLKIDIVENKFCSNLYDKRDAYNFEIIKLPHWNSNLHISIYRNILLNYINRNKKLVNNKYDKTANFYNMINTAIKYDYPIDFIYNYINNNTFLQ